MLQEKFNLWEIKKFDVQTGSETEQIKKKKKSWTDIILKTVSGSNENTRICNPVPNSTYIFGEDR